jgi:hypothetical protein
MFCLFVVVVWFIRGGALNWHGASAFSDCVSVGRVTVQCVPCDPVAAIRFYFSEPLEHVLVACLCYVTSLALISPTLLHVLH